MKTCLLTGAAIAVSTGLAAAQTVVGGAVMLPDRTIVGNAVNSADHTTLISAAGAAGMIDTFSGEGPFTVFAPINDAFDALPEGAVASLLKPGNIEALQAVLGCHVVAADVMTEALVGMIEADGGTHSVETMGGCMLEAAQASGTITLRDGNGRMATVTIPDVEQANGVIHVIDTVLLTPQ